MKFPALAHLWTGLGLVLSFAFTTSAFAVEIPKELQDVGIKEHLGAQVSIHDLKFKDETGRDVALSEYFRSGRPVVLALVYYQCPNLCNLVLNGVVKTLKELDWNVGKQFDVVAVSIDPKENPELAGKKKAAYMKSYDRAGTEAGWHFLTGADDQIHKLAGEVGFGYKWDGTQYAHGAAIYTLTPDGKISRYLYGIEYPKITLRMSLLEASNGKIGTIVDRIALFCYRYDPQTGKYSFYITRVMQSGAGLMVLLFGGYLLVYWGRERRRKVEAF